MSASLSFRNGFERFAASALVAVLTFVGGIDPPSARAANGPGLSAPAFDAQKADAWAAQRDPARADPVARLDRLLRDVHVESAAGQVRAFVRAGADANGVAAQVSALEPEITAFLATVQDGFDADRTWLREQQLPDLLPRVDEMERAALTRHAEVVALLANVTLASRPGGDATTPLLKLKEKLASFAPPRPGPLSAAAMRAESDLVRAGEPFADREAFRQWVNTHSGEPVLRDDFAPLAAPVAADLTETPEIGLTARIQAKAGELGGDPLRIYSWVRNNIRYVPGYGAAQSADFTLVNGQGTPFDISTLLIALLRASGVPARYATGRISVPAAQVKGWLEPAVGAAEAVEMLQMSGTPAVARVVGGVVEEAQLEHVWVEAWLDYEPSRGVVNRVGDSWVPMDASFKQHTVRRDIAPPNEQHPIGARVAAIWDAREVLPNGAFTRFDLDAVSDELFAFGDELVPDDMESGSALPVPEIVPQTLSSFPASLPYGVLFQGASFSEVPNALRYRVEVEVLRGGGNQLIPIGFSPVFSKTMPLARVGHGGINVEYAPANQTAETLLNALYVQAPSELSPYMIDVAPVIRLGEVIDEILTPVRMGETEQWRITVRDPFGLRPSQARPFQWTAGTQANISIDAFGVSSTALDDMTPPALQGQTVDSRTFLRSAGLGYWFAHDYYALAAGSAYSGRILRLPSIGAFYKPMTVRYFFGVPRRGAYVGYTTDVLTTVGPVASEPARSRNMMLAMGAWGSLLEGLIWDVQGGQTPGTASSSSSVLLAANEAGIPIHTIDETNLAQVLPLLQLNQDSIVEIRNAVNAGMIVMTPQTEVSIAGQPAVAGYIIRDPVTGAGLSRIDGSLNGSIVVGCLAEAISLDNLLNFLIGQMIQRILAPLIARGLILAAVALAIPGLAPIALVAATVISIVTLTCVMITMMQFAIDLATGGLEQAICNLLGSCMARKGYRRLLRFGRPIVPEIGMKSLDEVDFEGEGPFPLRFQRSYLSGGIDQGGIALGWSTPYFTRYKESENVGTSFVRVELLPRGAPFTPPALGAMADQPHAMLFLRENGGYFQFNRTPTGYTTVSNQADRLSSSGTGEARQWRYQAEDDVEERYDHRGRLLSITDRNGVSQTLQHNAQGQLLRVEHSLDRALSFTYHPSGQLATLTAPGNRVTRYEYQGLNLVRVIHPDNRSRRYHYEDERFPGKLTGVTDERGIRSVSVEYDYRGRAVQTTGPDGADRYRFQYYEGGFTALDPLGTTRTYRLTRVQDIWRATQTEQGCSACGTDVANTTFDARGYPATETDFEGNQTRTSYDERGLLRSQTDAVGTPLARTTTWDYDPTWRVMTRMVEPSATGGTRVTTQTLDAEGNVSERRVTVGATTRTWTWTYNEAGQVLTEDGPRTDVQDIVTYTYDAQGNRATMTDALGFVTQYTDYDDQGKLRETIDPNGLVTEYEYDARERLIAERVGPEASTAREATRYAYDDANNLTRITLPDDSFLNYNYNDAERLTRIDDSLGNRIEYGYDALGSRTAERTYDPAGTLAMTEQRAYTALGRLESITGARPQEITRFTYDDDGNEATATAPLHARPSRTEWDALDRLGKVVDPTGAEIDYLYDAQDNLRRVTDPRDLATEYGYNGFDELTQLISPDTGTSTYGFDAAGNLTSYTDSRSEQAVYGYDASNRLSTATWQDEGLTFQYDQSVGGDGARGELTTASTAPRAGSGLDATALSYTYDRHGRVTGKTQTVGSAAALTTTHAYDTAGRIAATTLPSGVQISYGYGSDGRVLTISVNGVQIVREIEYFPLGEPKAWRYGSSGRYARVFDQDGRLREHSVGATTRTLSYDFAGRVNTLADAATPQSSWDYGYDEADRLTAADNAASSGPTANLQLAWSFDLTGNRTQQTRRIGAASPIVTDYTIASSSNRLMSLNSGSALMRGYDAAGNTVGWRAEGGDFARSDLIAAYSARSRVVSIERNDAGGRVPIGRYAYNAFGERAAKWIGVDATIPGGVPTRQYVYDESSHLIGEYNGTGPLVSEHVWLDDTPVALIKPAGTGANGQLIPSNGTMPSVEVFFVHPDQIDSPRALVNTANQVAWRWESAPFGEDVANEQPTSGLAPVVYSLRFPGQQYDPETGQHYNYLRDYEPDSGRYAQTDPIGLEGGVGTYLYVVNQPLLLFDATGECPKKNRRRGKAFERLFGATLGKFLGPGCKLVKKSIRTPWGMRFPDWTVECPRKPDCHYECKVGGSPYKPSQRKKDKWIEANGGGRTIEVRR